jgi:hypothetical protein
VPSRGRARTTDVPADVCRLARGRASGPPRPARVATPPAWPRAARSGA